MSTNGKDSISRMLESIKSDKDLDEINSQYNQLQESNKEIGAPTNNILLRALLEEQKRTNRYLDGAIHEFRNLGVQMSSFTDAMNNLTDSMNEVVSTMRDQMEIQASLNHSLHSSETPTLSTPAGKRHTTIAEGEWFYHAFKLANKYNIIACVLMQLTDIVKLRLENTGKFYPDSVDCSFSLMSQCISKICNVRCSLKGIDNPNPISIREKTDPGFKVILPIIASRSPISPVNLREEQAKELLDPRLRNIMQEVEWVRQRVCKLVGLLSPQQCDILESLQFPVATADGEINWDPSKINIRKSHPIHQDVERLGQLQKFEYAISLMKGKTPTQAYTIAEAFEGSKSKDKKSK